MTSTMEFLAFATIVFAAALALVEVTDSSGDDLTVKPISHYFSTATRGVQDTMFIVMAFALWCHAYTLGANWLSISLALVGLGLVGAMSTDTWPKAFFGFDRQVHYTSAGLCFVAGLSMMLAKATYVYAVAYALGALLLTLIDPKHTSVQEKIGVLMLIIWVFGYAVQLT